jgi:hypothetical protein
VDLAANLSFISRQDTTAQGALLLSFISIERHVTPYFYTLKKRSMSKEMKIKETHAPVTFSFIIGLLFTFFYIGEETRPMIIRKRRMTAHGSTVNKLSIRG